MVELAIVAFIVAVAVVLAASFVVVIDCGSDDECTRLGGLQFVLAAVAFASALVMLLASLLRRGRPGLWFCATALMWAVWAFLVWLGR